MILDRDAYDRLRVTEEQNRLAALSPAESLSIGEALWSSEFAATVVLGPRPRGLDWARHLQISDERLKAAWAAYRG